MGQHADILTPLTAVFREVFDDATLVIGRDTSARDISHWDSFAHINLIVGIEEAFQVQFSTADIGAFTCVGDVIDRLAGKAA